MTDERYELPEGWEMPELNDLLLKISNGTTKTQTKKFTNFPVTRIETISDGTVNFDKVGYLTEPLSVEDTEKYQVLKNDILFSNINSDCITLQF